MNSYNTVRLDIVICTEDTGNPSVFDYEIIDGLIIIKEQFWIEHK